MRKLQWLLFAAGAAAFALLLKQMGVEKVGAALMLVGWGFALVFAQEVGAIFFNTLGWRLAFRPEHAREIPFGTLLRLRVIGDALNYLTPTAGLAGEWARTAMLGPAHALSVRLASVTVAKLTQALAMLLSSALVLALFLQGRVLLAPLSAGLQVGAWLLGGLLGLVLLLQWRASHLAKTGKDAGSKTGIWSEIKKLDREILALLRDHPARIAASVGSFLLAYLWNAIEVMLITHFLGVPVSWATAIAIEALSVMMDGLFLMVPGKVGTQEATRTAIFAGLGLDPAAGFSYGVVRHLREIAWALAGLGLFYADSASTRAPKNQK